MGNRAIIATEERDLAVYLHWNGGRDSVEPILEYCRLKGYRPPEQDCYGWARIAQVIGNFFGGTTAVGIDTYDRLKTAGDDNGAYIIRGWEIVDREYPYKEFAEQDEYDPTDVIKYIDRQMPAREQLGEDFIDAPVVSTRSIQVGDMVYLADFDGQYHLHRVVGHGDSERLVGGRIMDGVPFINKWGDDDEERCRSSVNNYLTEPTYRIAKKGGKA